MHETETPLQAATRWTIGALIVLAIGGVAAVYLYPDCARQILPAAAAEAIGLAKAQPEFGTTGGERAVPVRAAVARPGALASHFETTGEVVAEDEVVLTTEIARRVAEVYVEDGASLSAGDRVLRFDSTSETIAVAAARARVAEAEAELDRARQLADDGYAPQSRVEAAQTARRTAKVELEAAQAALDDLTIRSPFPGDVGFLFVSEGAYLAPGDRIARLVSDDLRVRMTVPVEIADQIDGSEEIEIRRDDSTCGSARVLLLSPLADPSARTREVEVTLPGTCDARPGAFVEVRVVLPSGRQGAIVPHASVLRQGFEAAVFRIVERDDGLVAIRTPVELGVFREDRVEIADGLSPGDRVVASGLQKVRDGVPVRILERPDK